MVSVTFLMTAWVKPGIETDWPSDRNTRTLDSKPVRPDIQAAAAAASPLLCSALLFSSPDVVPSGLCSVRRCGIFAGELRLLDGL